MSDRYDIMRNGQPQQNNMKYGASYQSVYPEPQKKFNKGLNQQISQQQEFLSQQNQFDNQQSYYYQQQQQDMYFDNDSMLSSNMIPLNPPFSESQEDICDMYFNPSAFLQNQEKNQSNELQQQNSMVLPNNQDIYYDIEQGECVQNGVEDFANQNDMQSQSYLLPPSNSNIENMKNINNFNFSQNVYVPIMSHSNQSISNSIQVGSLKSIYGQLCASCHNQPIMGSNQQLCSYCLVLQNQQQVKFEMPEENIPAKYQPQQEQSQVSQQEPAENNQQKVVKHEQLKNSPINNGIIDDAEVVSDDCEDYEQNISLENNKYGSEESNSSNYNSSKNCSEYQVYSDQYQNDKNSQENSQKGGRKNKKNSSNEEGSQLISKKSIKKYKPKKKYKQSRQKNVFKNFGNALMNCIQNNFVIRDYIEKCLGNDSSNIEAFHNAFLKDSLNNLKNKEDFLQGWRIQEQMDSSQVKMFKQVFKEVSLRFFNDYAAKYVNESDKLKNKDIHIKAIPIFIKGLQNVNELYKFKLS